MATDRPYYISGHISMVTNPLGPGQSLKSGLIVCCIDSTKDNSSQQGLPISYTVPGDRIPKNNIKSICKSGNSFVGKKGRGASFSDISKGGLGVFVTVTQYWAWI